MVPMELLPLEDDVGDDAEDNKRDDFLDDLQLHQRERSAIVDEADTVCWYEEAILNAGDAPREKYHGVKRPVGGDTGLIELQMSVPGKCHKDIAANQQQNCIKCIHRIKLVNVLFWQT